MKNPLVHPELLLKVLLLISFMVFVSCDDDDDDSSYGAREEIQEKMPDLMHGEEVVMYKA